MDYASLTSPKGTPGSIAEWVNYAPLASQAPDIVKNAQDELFSRLRVREMRKSLSGTLAVGQSSVPLPIDFLDADSLIGPYQNKIKRVSEDRLLSARCYDTSGALILSYATRYAIFDGAIQFDCGAIEPVALSGLYYAATYISPAVGAPGDPNYVAPVLTNVLTSRYSHLFRAMLLKHAYAYRKDWQAASLYESQAEKNLADIEQNDDLSYRGLDDDDEGARP